MRVYDGANWIAATSAGNVSLILYEYTATSGQTTFSGSDDNSATLSYTVDNLQVVMNGVILDPSDFTATNGTSVVLASGAALNDLVNIYAFKSFTVADTVSASAGGTFSANVAITGDLTVDTDTLFVDATNNNVGIGLSSPLTNYKIHVDANSGSDGRVARFSQAGTDNAIVDVTAQNGTNTEAFSRYRNDANFFSVGIDSNDNFSIGKSFANTIGNTRVTVLSGGGLTFNGDTAAANALDDYERGTYTISEVNGDTTVTTNRANYIKIGSLVYVDGSVNLGSSSSSSVLNLSLPFSSTEGTNGVGGGAVGFNNLGTTIANATLRPCVENLAGNVFFRYGENNQVTCANASSKRIDWFVMYTTDG
jgi:hypothetical protein